MRATTSSSTSDGPHAIANSETDDDLRAVSTMTTSSPVVSTGSMPTQALSSRFITRRVRMGCGWCCVTAGLKSDLQDSHCGTSDEVERFVDPAADGFDPFELEGALRVVIEVQETVVDD